MKYATGDGLTGRLLLCVNQQCVDAMERVAIGNRSDVFFGGRNSESMLWFCQVLLQYCFLLLCCGEAFFAT